ncbi:MAG: hypothetical protein U9N35_04460 [Euryarchaeota archaeon]|nr:hypothetical protein [Euryarchaeota archaeon]
MKKLIERAVKNVKDEYKVRMLIDPGESDILDAGIIPESVKTEVYKSPLGVYIELVGKAEDVMNVERDIQETLEMNYTKSNKKAAAKA